jgi:short-subunit dehydrogenase
MKHRNGVLLGAGIGVCVATILRRRTPTFALGDKTVFVTGGSRGLGFLMAQEFARRGARVAISARRADELQRALTQLRRITSNVLAIEGDITMRDEAENAVQRIAAELGPVDVLVNNAGTITVGPMETMTIDEYRDSINTHFWGPYFSSMAVLPGMKKRRRGRIVNISSVGGKLAVPHLLPYSVGKFALTGFSEGLHAELRKDNIYVTTVCPGLMRTGSPRNATFKGKHKAEYAWFSISDALPLISMSASRAARQIVNATRRGDAELVLSLPAKLAVILHGLFPGTVADMLSLANEMLPEPGGIDTNARTGQQSASRLSPSFLTILNEEAAAENNEVA